MSDRGNPQNLRNVSGRASNRSGTPAPPTCESTRAALMATIANASCPVKDARSAQAYLTERQIISAITDIDKQKIIDTLLTVTTYKNVSAEATATIRAVAFLIMEDDPSGNVQAAISAIEDKISTSMKTMSDTVLTSYTAKLDEAQKFVEALTQSQAETTLKINQTLTSCSALETSLTAASDTLQSISAAPATHQGTRSWADIAATPANANANANTAPQHAYDPTQSPETLKLRQRLLTRNRTLMIEPSTINESSATVIRENANAWLKEVDDSSSDEAKPSTIIKAATPQTRGGLLLEFDSAASANRFRYYIATNSSLASKFGPEAKICEQSHKLVMRFIPCDGGFEPSEPAHLREFETNSGLEAHSITSMSWCRPIDKRAANQSFATATIIINSPKAANHLLTENIYIYEKCITVQKDIRQPLLCNKCQQYGHIHRECPNELKCVTCTGAHDISTCTLRDRPACVSCGPNSRHPSNDHQCPAFQRRVEDLHKRFPEDTLPLFPTHDDPSTWESAPAGFTAPPPQPQYNRPPRPAYPQRQNQINR